MLPAIKLVPVGTVSFTFTVVGAVPVLLSSLIVYVIISFCFTSTFAGLASLLGITFGLFTSIVTVFVSVPSTFAVFVNSFSNTFSKLSTVTSNEIVVCPTGTFTVIPFFRFSSVSVGFVSLFTFILPSTNVVPSGTSS